MKYGLQQEPVAVELYVNMFCMMKAFKVGFVINSSAYYLGCLPDRRVYDAAIEKYGLVEIKCPSVEKISDCNRLLEVNGQFRLKRNHEYYYQVMGQLGITGCNWCDFFVMTYADFHKERIVFDVDLWNSMKDDLDFFYFNYFLPYLAKQ